jgi:cytochrome c biogenesis protein CcmG, thiol:disulfide interchange protein DsbE
MSRLSKYRVLIAGVLAPIGALVLYTIVYSGLTAASTDRDKDWLFRLAVSTLAMTVPFFITCVLALREGRTPPLPTSAKVGLALAVLSLALAWSPIHDGMARWKQSQNMALHDVPAPAFSTPDIDGKTQALADHKGEVVLVNIWATWCGPCRAEMPRLEKLYQDRKPQGFVVFGLSSEDVAAQRKFLQSVPVTYPLLTLSGDVPTLYRDIARYPAIFLIDRQGRLQPAPGPDQPFEKIEAAVDALLQDKTRSGG